MAHSWSCCEEQCSSSHLSSFEWLRCPLFCCGTALYVYLLGSKIFYGRFWCGILLDSKLSVFETFGSCFVTWWLFCFCKLGWEAFWLYDEISSCTLITTQKVPITYQLSQTAWSIYYKVLPRITELERMLIRNIQCPMHTEDSKF